MRRSFVYERVIEEMLIKRVMLCDLPMVSNPVAASLSLTGVQIDRLHLWAPIFVVGHKFLEYPLRANRGCQLLQDEELSWI